MKSIILSICLSAIGIQANAQAKKTEIATFGMGCFWCTEAIFQRLEGVISVESGFEGGAVNDPSYEAVSTGMTGHAEVSQIVFDPSKISYKNLLEVFWKSHDPTSLNRQGADEGTQYRSVIFYHNKEQKALALKYKKALNDDNTYGKKIVTEISSAKPFYKADESHQNYYNLNSNKPYCKAVIQPKLEKLEKLFKDKLKKK